MKNKLNRTFQRLSFYLFFLLLMLCIKPAFSQQGTISGIVIQGTIADIPASNGIESQNPVLNELLHAFQVTSYTIAYPVAKNQKAKKCFHISIDNATDNDYKNLLKGRQVYLMRRF